MLGWGEGCNSRSEGWPINGRVGGIVPFLGPVFGNGWLRDEIVNASFVKLGLFVEAKIQGPAFVRESWVGVGDLLLYEYLNVCFGYVIGDDIVLGDG